MSKPYTNFNSKSSTFVLQYTSVLYAYNHQLVCKPQGVVSLNYK